MTSTGSIITWAHLGDQAYVLARHRYVLTILRVPISLMVAEYIGVRDAVRSLNDRRALYLKVHNERDLRGLSVINALQRSEDDPQRVRSL